MNTRVHILKPLGECVVGELLAVQIDGLIVEGTVQLVARAPQGGWILSFAADSGFWEIFARDGECSVVSHLLADPDDLWQFESARVVADTRTGLRFGTIAQPAP